MTGSYEPKIAIVGMSCLFPRSPNLAAFWSNIVGGVDCLRDSTAEEWDPARFYSKEPTIFEQIYCKRGGFITELADFDPLKYGVMPNSIKGTDPDQLLALRVASEALADAGYANRDFNRERAEVILGRTSAPGAGAMNLIQQGQTVGQMLQVISALHPEYTPDEMDAIAETLRLSLSRCSSDTIPGVMPNVMAGRIAGRLGFNGRSMILDSACASSLIAVETAVNDLLSGRCDLALSGGIHINAFACFYQIFCGLGALSPTEQIKPFDAQADGTLLGEGLGIVVLKRLEDAIRDEDRVYAVLRGIGSSSDGHGTAMLAPSVDGEAIALRRAYDMAQVSPKSVALLEAHGTGTPSGDVVEMQAVEKVFGSTSEPWCAVGSVKSMIGHCQAASGIAGLIKAALALYHKILPPTLHVSKPNPQIDWQKSPCYINTKSRTWIHPQPHPRIPQELAEALNLPKTEPRRAAVSAFGFGGVNAHAVLEEYRDPDEIEKTSLLQEWDTELCLIYAATEEALIERLSKVESFLANQKNSPLKDVAYTLCHQYANDDDKERVAIVASSTDDLLQKLHEAKGLIKTNSASTPQSTGIYISADDKVKDGKTAFILPGLGAAYPNMLAELCLHFPDVRAVFDFVDELSLGSSGQRLPSKRIFPLPQASESASSLASMDSAVVTVLMAEWALFTMLSYMEITPDTFIGCSTGEFAALTMCGAIDLLEAAPLFYDLSTTVASSIPPESLSNLRSLKVDADYSRVKVHFEDLQQVYLGAELSPKQFIVSGSKDDILQLSKRLAQAKVEYTPLPTAIPYHTPLVAGYVHAENAEVKALNFSAPMISSWSCSAASAYPDDPEALRKISTELFTHPIRLKETIEAAYQGGCTKFVEIGPKGSLTPVIEEILSGKPHLAVAANTSLGSALTQLQTMLACLASNNVTMQADYLFARRNPQLLDIEQLVKPNKPSSTIRLSLAYPEIKLSAQQSADLKAKLRTGESRRYSHSPSPDHLESGEDEEFGLDEEPLAADPEADVMEGYLANIATFHQNLMQMQADVMRTYIGTHDQLPAQDDECDAWQPSIATLAPGAACDLTPLPLLATGQINFFDPVSGALEIAVRLTLNEHKYLLDHAIGGPVSTFEGTPERVYLMPLTVALEMMCEAGALFFPERKVLRISQVRAVKRIRVDGRGLPVVLRSRLVANDSVECEIIIQGLDSAAMSCRVTFADSYNAAPPVVSEGDETQRSPKILSHELYASRYMFHGPRMQSVRALESVGRKQIKAVLEARPANDWFDQVKEPKFLIDPLLLDNSTQPVLFHLFEHDENVSALLPFLIDSIDFYQDLSQFRGLLQVAAQLNSLTSRGTEADVRIVAADGRMIACFNAISSRRISLNPLWKAFIADPLHTVMSKEIPAGANQALFVLDQSSLAEDESTLTWCSDYVLSAREQETFFALPNLKRKREWLLGRIAAKDALRHLLRKHGVKDVRMADIETRKDDAGSLVVDGQWLRQIEWQPAISISHKDAFAVALAVKGRGGTNCGVDMESIEKKEEGFEKLACTDAEIKALSATPAALRDSLLIKFWCAKEAVGKALFKGLSNNPKSLEVRSLDANGKSNNFSVSVSAKDAARNGASYLVHCLEFGNHIIATTTLEKA